MADVIPAIQLEALLDDKPELLQPVSQITLEPNKLWNQLDQCINHRGHSPKITYGTLRYGDSGEIGYRLNCSCGYTLEMRKVEEPLGSFTRNPF
jgi:hypothetical protein